MIFEKYTKFVKDLTSPASKNMDDLITRLTRLSCDNPDINVPGMITGSKGLTCEAAELEDIIKKIVFQGKDLSDETLEHLRLELGDVMFYLAMLCDAIGIHPDTAMQMNMDKLNNRYSSGGFSVSESEHRKKDDK